MMRLLLLAGTTEAREIAAALAGNPRIEVIVSLASGTRMARPLGVATRIGGFGGSDGFTAYLAREGIGAVLDATHPFAVEMSHRTRDLCSKLGLPCAQVLRPGWTPGPGDRWTTLNDEAEAAQHIPPGAQVFVATGRQTLERYAGMGDRMMICRQIDASSGPFPLRQGYFLPGRPPFTVAQEVALFRRLSIDWLIVKNAGGDASRTKLDAARQLNLPVAMIRRPLQPLGVPLETVADALGWVKGLQCSVSP